MHHTPGERSPFYPTKACSGKVRYPTREAAARILEAMRDASEFDSYKCPACGTFHITSVHE